MSHQISPIIDTETMRSDSKKTLETEIEMHSMSNSPQRESRAVHDSHLATLTSTPRLGLSCLCVHQNWIIAGSDHVSGLLFAWDFDAESTTTPVTIEGHSGPVTGLLDLGSSFVSSSKDGTIQEWKDFSLRQIVNEDSLSMLRKKGHPLCMAHQWDNNGSSGSLFSGGTDTKIYEWDVEEGTSVEGYFQGHSGWVNVLALSLDGSTLASGSTDRTIRLWNIETRECIAELTGHLDWITALAFDSQEYLISGCRDGIIRKWSLNDKESKELYHGEPVRSIQLLTHPDSHSSSLIFMGDDKTIYAQDMSSLEIKTRLNGHFGGIRASVLTKGRLLTASRDGTVRKWRLKDLPMDLDVESALLNLSDRVSLVKQPRSQSKTTKLERELSMTRMELAQLKLQFDKQRKLIHDQERMRHELALKESLAYEHKRQADQALVMLESVLDVALSQAESQLLLSSSLLEDFHFLLHDFHSPLFIKSDYGYGSRDDCSVPTLAPQDPENRSGASTPETIFSPSEPITPLSQASESIGDPIASFEKMAVAFEKSVEKAIDRPWKLVPSWFG